MDVDQNRKFELMGNFFMLRKCRERREKLKAKLTAREQMQRRFLRKDKFRNKTSSGYHESLQEIRQI